MLTLNDGRSELWQWDTGRTLAVDADCSQVHFSNKVFGRSIDVDVADGVAIIPDILLQTDKDLNVWAFVGTSDNGYTKISKTFTVNRRNKPADYVFTPTDQMTLQTIQRQIGDLTDLTTEAKDTLVAAINEAARTGGGGSSDAVLYTTQTLTDAQKKQARDNIDAASYFVVNGTANQSGTVTLDKTYVQINEAANSGKNVFARITLGNFIAFMPLTQYDSGLVKFAAAFNDNRNVCATELVVAPSSNALNINRSPGLNDNRNMLQISMASDPTEAMQIATKKYVDDHATAGPTVPAGAPGITPTIGPNGNWYLGEEDTGKPSRGATGSPGKDGHSPVVTATKSGKTTTISVDGTAIATVEDGVAGTPGKNGTDGHTPVKGTDYWTASDKAEIVAEVTDALPKYGGESE